MQPSPFRYERPGRLDEAIALLSESPEETMPLAGGQSLLPILKLRFMRPTCLVDLAGLRELTGVGVDPNGEGLCLGAMVRHAEVASAAEVVTRCPLLAEAAHSIGDPHVRNRGTVGGGICHADPTGALPVAAMAVDAALTLVGPDGERRVPASEFFVDYLTADVGPGEILTRVAVPDVAGSQGWSFMELRQRRLDLATLVVAVQLVGTPARIDRARVVIGGGGAVPARVSAAEEALAGQRPVAALASSVQPVISSSLEAYDSDLASAEYKRDMAGVLGRRAIEQAVARLDGGEG